MTFNSLQYLLLLGGVVVVNRVLPARLRGVWILACSYVFYASFDVRFTALLAGTTLVTHLCARGIASGGGRSRLFLAVGVAWAVSMLGFFKYFDFFMDSASGLADAVGWRMSTVDLRILLPVGISFYSFQAIAYLVSLWRGHVQQPAKLVDVATFLAFFPSILAGPLEKPWRLLPRIEGLRSGVTVVHRRDLGGALLLILLGLTKKVVLADTAAAVVGRTYADPGGMHWVALVAGTLAFTVQLYFDFSGYTDIARGSARLLGIDLMENFREPYLSRRPSEFWSRWNISLSEWLRDYVYIPLGGARRGRFREHRNLMATMLVGGLWHGAAWTFVAWGALWGLALVADRFIPGPRRRDEPVRLSDTPAILGVLGVTVLGWILFRADSFTAAREVLVGVLTLRSGEQPVEVLLVPALVLATALYSVGRRIVREGRVDPRRSPALSGALVGACVVGLVVFSGAPAVDFVYLSF